MRSGQNRRAACWSFAFSYGLIAALELAATGSMWVLSRGISDLAFAPEGPVAVFATALAAPAIIFTFFAIGTVIEQSRGVMWAVVFGVVVVAVPTFLTAWGIFVADVVPLSIRIDVGNPELYRAGTVECIVAVAAWIVALAALTMRFEPRERV